MRFHGVIPAVVTPFDPEGKLDPGSLTRLTQSLIDSGATGIVANGTMGEASSLTREERVEVVRTVVATAEDRVPVTVGISAPTARMAIDYGRDASEAGALGLMMLPAQGYRADEEEVIAFFEEVVAGVELPLMVYNNPEASGFDLSPRILARVARLDRVTAIKETSGDARRIAELVFALDDTVDVLVGGDDCALEGAANGAVGWVSGVANVAPVACIELFQRARSGDLEGARDLYRRILPLARLDMTPKLVQYFKAALASSGRDVGTCRPPRQGLNDAEADLLEDALMRLGAIEQTVGA